MQVANHKTKVGPNRSSSKGFHVIRFTNEDVLRNLDAVLEEIHDAAIWRLEAQAFGTRLTTLAPTLDPRVLRGLPKGRGEQESPRRGR